MAAIRLAFQQYICKGLQRDKPPIVILHGVLGSKRNWRVIARKLVEEMKRNVYVVDARNHGNSPHLPEMTYEMMSEDTADFMKTNTGKGVVIGHSMGGKTAMVLSLTHPELVERLVVVDVAPVSSPNTFNMNNYLEALSSIDLSSIKSTQQVDTILQASIPDKKIRGFLLTNLIKDTNTGVYKWIPNIAAIKHNMTAISSFPQLGTTYNGPTTFIGGANSDYINTDVYSDIKKYFPLANITHINDAGHWVHADKPSELVTILKQFIQS